MSQQSPIAARSDFRAHTLAATALCLFAATAANAGSLADPEQLTTQLEQIRTSNDAYHAAVRGGAERVAFCSYCHGKDGNSIKAGLSGFL